MYFFREVFRSLYPLPFYPLALSGKEDLGVLAAAAVLGGRYWAGRIPLATFEYQAQAFEG